jgi:hypothetical protein
MMTSFMRRVVPLMILAVGCSDGSGPGDVGDGEFEFTVTGELDRTVTGDAFFVVGDGGAGEDGLAIVLSTGEEGFILSRFSTALPTVGTTYNIVNAPDAGPNDFVLAGFFGSGASFTHLCESGSASDTGGPVFGSVTFTEAGANLAGTFTTTVGCLNYSTGAVTDATASGAFDAEEVDESQATALGRLRGGR